MSRHTGLIHQIDCQPVGGGAARAAAPPRIATTADGHGREILAQRTDRGRLSGLGTDRRQNNRFGAGITVSQADQDSAPDRRLFA